jgi:hypothetical protein
MLIGLKSVLGTLPQALSQLAMLELKSTYDFQRSNRQELHLLAMRNA